MEDFAYEGLNNQGKNISGTISAENDTAARLSLKSRNIFIIRLAQKRKQEIFSNQRLNPGEFVISIRELSTLLNSGLTLDESLGGLINQMRPGRLKDMYVDIHKNIREGKSFSSAVSLYPDAFSKISVSMLKAGEATGKTDVILDRIAQFMESRLAFKNKILGVMTYPIFIGIFGILVLIFVLTFIAPTITRLFQEASIKLPLPTQILIAISSFLKNYVIFIIICLAVLIFFLSKYFSGQAGKIYIDRLRYKIPFLRELFLKGEIVNFSRTMGTLLESGVEILTSFDIAKEVIFSPLLKEEISQVREMISHGVSLSSALAKTTLFPYTVIQLVSAGEKSGHVPEMFKKISENFQEELSQKTTRFVTILEPAMIVFMAIIVGFVVISIMLPIFQISESIK
ncbi:MAG: type II secretion system F family protein [Candidatus Omnitrophica bacterium]|nr:type II secretion system F family protein [Candidatus Omnitrophota bacterium]